jgi:chromate reductase, NAD(P)H dehydrogenase (quinone)
MFFTEVLHAGKHTGFCRQFAQCSYNRALLRVASELVPQGTSLEIFDLEGIPLFNQDLEVSIPRKVVEFKQKIKSSDALLIVSPEHNYSVPGVLKNAIDWASRPYGDNSFKGKPVAVMSASTGMLGGARAQYHLRQMFVFLDMFPINKPEVFVTLAAQKFDSEGKLLDEKSRELIRDLVKSLVDWTIRITE